jgi:hypothetical protein
MDNSNANVRKPGSLDLGKFRIAPNSGETLGSKKLVTHVPVGKPGKGRFFRSSKVDPNSIDVYIFEDKEEGTFHLVSPEIADVLGSLVRAVTLHLAIDRANNPLLVPVPLPDANGQRNSWPQSLLGAIEYSREKWVRIESDKSAGVYQVHEAQGALEEPKWPDLSLDELVNIAFAGRVINNLEHPKVQSALGKI